MSLIDDKDERMELVPGEYGNDLLIKQVKVTNDDGKYIKFAKLNKALIKALKEKGTISVKS